MDKMEEENEENHHINHYQASLHVFFLFPIFLGGVYCIFSSFIEVCLTFNIV